MLKRRQLMGAAALLPTFAFANASEDWPNSSVKIVVGFPPGQASDIIARILADDLSRTFGKPFVVENRAGAGATIAAGLVAKAPKDGYTLLFSSSGPLTVAPNLYPNLAYDAVRDIDPVLSVGWSPLILLVPASSPYRSVKELVDASLSGTQLFYGSGGNGVTNHLAMELFKQVSGARFTHIPYKGAGPALTDLMAGNIQILFETATAALPQVAAGKLRALAVSTSRRYPELPDVPTVQASYPGFEAVPWGIFCVPDGTPKYIKERLEAALTKSLGQEDIRKKMLSAAFVAEKGMGQERSRAFLASETKKWKSVIEMAHIKVD
jgi:tripartite-type tricarboxylate transporter receptor subunit TctC